MREKELLNAMSEIKEEYIEDADLASCKQENEFKKVSGKKPFNWKVWGASIAAVCALCIGVGALGSNMFRAGSSKADTVEAPAAMAEAEEYYYDNGYGINSSSSTKGEAYYATDEAAEYSKEIENSGSSVANQVKAETKLIKRAHVYLQTLEFDKSEEALRALVESVGGYFESSNVENGGYYSDGYWKNGYYTVRVPADKYDEFLESVGDSCHVSSISESVEDIGEQYFDTETRLKTLRTKYDRLQELLAKASDLSDIIALESEISNTEYQIDSYTSTLNRYDSLVGYATIEISLESVYRVDDGVSQNNSYFARLWRSLKNGLVNFVDSVGDIISWAAYNLVGIIIVVVAIVIIRKNHLLRKLGAAIGGLFRKKDQ